MIQDQIQNLRAKDKAKELTYPKAHVKLSPNILQGLQEVLEEIDSIGQKEQAKFYARTIFISLALNGGDSVDSKYVVQSLVKTSIYQAYKISQNPQQFDNFMEKQNSSELEQYYQSEQHQLIVSQVQPHDFCITTPYDYAEIANQTLGIPNLKYMITCFVDLALALPSSSQMSSEEIFVGCVLYIYHKSNIPELLTWLGTHFQDSLSKGCQLKNQLIEMLLETNDEA